jgi:S-adenosylmethionine hydrolase
MPATYTETVTTRAEARGAAHRSHRPVVSLLSDFGTREPSAGIMRAVIATIARDIVILDLTHDVDKFAVRDGALHLWSAVPYLPIGTHVAVVDPGVGTARYGIAVQTLRGDHLVGPDNGLLMPAAARLGGITKAHVLEDPRFRLSPVSTSFHGRDVFAPAAAHLATGTPIEDLGRPLDPRQLQDLDWPRPVVRSGVLDSHVLYVDGFGNIKLSALGGDLNAALPGLRPGEPVLIRVGDGTDVTHRTTWAATFGSVPKGATLLYLDSFGRVCLAVNQGSAADLIGLATDSPISIARETPPTRPVRRPTSPASPTVYPPTRPQRG